MGGDVAGEEFEARGEAHDEEKKLDEAHDLVILTAVLQHETARPRNTKPRGRGTPSSSEKEERSFDGSLFRQRPPASGQPKAGARDKHTAEIFLDTGIHSWVGIPLRS